MRVFPRWARHLGIDAALTGMDCRIHDDPAVYRRVVLSIRDDPGTRGALVTTHKIDLYAAARDLLDETDRYAKLLGEVSCISKTERGLAGKALDPVTGLMAMDGFLPSGYWETSGAELCIFGAGGASLAITAGIMERSGTEPPRRIVVTDPDPYRLERMERIHASLRRQVPVEYVRVDSAASNDEAMAGLAPGSVVVNATGLGKDAPGSPVSDTAAWPRDGYVWELNYRGERRFLGQAEGAKDERGLHVEDGRLYFIHGWLRVISEVFGLEIPSSGPEFERLSEIAAPCFG